MIKTIRLSSALTDVGYSVPDFTGIKGILLHWEGKEQEQEEFTPSRKTTSTDFWGDVFFQGWRAAEVSVWMVFIQVIYIMETTADAEGWII